MYSRKTSRPVGRHHAAAPVSIGAGSKFSSVSSNESPETQTSAVRQLTLPVFVQNFGTSPDRARSLASYASLAGQYDRTISRIKRLRQETVDSLELRPGDHVLDVACGTGDTLIALAQQVSPGGRVVGVEQSEQMAAVALGKVRQSRFDDLIDIVVCPTEDLAGSNLFDAVFMSFTHDVLQNRQAVGRLSTLARPGSRVAVSGMRFLPWWWAAPINLFSAFRARQYLTTYRGLRTPREPLLPHVPDFQVQKTYLLGTCYRGIGKFARHQRSPRP